MQISERERFLLFDFLSFISMKYGIKIEYLEVMKEYEESRRGEYK